MVKDYNYPIERHFYETEDGYINSLFRISGPRFSNPKENLKRNEQKPVILYQHGLMDSCAGILCDGLKSMAFFFADAGFDVWMNNSRGTCFSRQHKYLDPDVDKEYWDYSFQEMGMYD
ncbi:MAG: hypothetical protein ACK521_08215 [bacterium]|jgi:hypothetical protein